MSMFGFSTKEGAPQRTDDDGVRWSRLPSVDGIAEGRVVADACKTCSKLAQHGPVCTQHGHVVTTIAQDPNLEIGDTVPAQKTRAQDARELFLAAKTLEFIHHQIVDNIIYNAGDAGANYYQKVRYEVVSTSGDSAVLKGANPKRLILGTSSRDPETGVIVTGEVAHALAVGAQVRFLSPSVLVARPWIVSIDMPASNAADDVTFTVHLSHTVNHAREPYDEAFEPADGKYFCDVLWYALSPDASPNFQERTVAYFTKHAITVSSEDAAAGWTPLPRTNGEDGRVLYPSMLAAGMTKVTAIPADGPVVVLEDMEARLVTEQTDFAVWQTRLYLQDIAEDYVTFQIEYWPEAVEGDQNLLMFQGSCANAQTDPTLSYRHSTTHRCTAVETADQFITFQDVCWQPNCSKFCLGTEGRAFRGGNMIRPPSDWLNGTRLGQLMNGTPWVLEQTVAGFTHFTLKRPTGAFPGLITLCGGWAGGIPVGKFPQRNPLYGATFGIREEYEEDGTKQRLVHGAWARQGEWTAGTIPSDGVIPTYASGWKASIKGVRGESVESGFQLYPSSPFGTSHVYEWAAENQDFQHEPSLVESISWALNARPDDSVDLAFDALVAAIVNGTEE